MLRNKGKTWTTFLPPPPPFPGSASRLHSWLLFLPTPSSAGGWRGCGQSITAPLCRSGLLTLVPAPAWGLPTGCSPSGKTCSSTGSLRATVPSGHVHILWRGVLHGLQRGYLFQHGPLHGLQEIPAPLWSLQGLQGDTCSTRIPPGSQGNLCLGPAVSAVGQSQPPLTETDPPTSPTWAPAPSTQFNLFLFQKKLNPMAEKL